jgi:nucleotide-binding universal stress UspA family protein
LSLLEKIVPSDQFYHRLAKVVDLGFVRALVAPYYSHRAFDQRAFGSTTTTVISQVNFPILVVPEEASFSELKHIVYAYKYSSLESDNQLSLLRELALTFDAQVRVLHVDQPPVAGEGMAISYKKYPNLESILEGINHHDSFLVEEDSTQAIQAGTNDYQANLLVMTPQTHGFWDTVMNRSVTRKIAFQTNIPLLTLPNPLHHAILL